MELFCDVRTHSNSISLCSTSHWHRIRWPSSSARPGISSNRPRRCCGTGISTPFANISRRSRTRDLFRLIVNLPPRSGKSLLTSVLWPAWVWTKQPSTRWLCASYSASLAVKFSIDRRTVITSQWYQERWPILLAGDQNQKQEFMNDARGHMIATSPAAPRPARAAKSSLLMICKIPRWRRAKPSAAT